MHGIEIVSETYAWYQSVGNRTEQTPLAHYVYHVEHGEIWVANHLSRVRAETPSEIAAVLRRADEVFAHCSHRMAIVDSLTPDPFIARLALDGFTELTPTLQMVLEGTLQTAHATKFNALAASRDFALHPVLTDADWDELYPLVRANHLEGDSSHHLELEEDISRRIFAGYRAKSTVCQFFIARLRGVPCGYGSAIVGPHGMGLVEDLFTLQAYRRLGLATAVIAHAVAHARARGMGPMLIGAHVTEEPKALYAALGFVPRSVTRQYLRQ